MYGGNQHYGNNLSGGGPPPLPAKVPMGGSEARGQLGSRQGFNSVENGGDAWALLEEMKNIDLGSGRARRRGR